MKLEKKKHYQEWLKIVKPVLEHEEFLKRKNFIHHGKLDVYTHSARVSYSAFVLAKWFRVNKERAALAGLLHDFYPYAWIDSEKLDDEARQRIGVKRKLKEKHGFVHAKEAALNYQKFFPELVDKRITNAIERHMFPLNIRPPRYYEGWFVTLADKKCSVCELEFMKALPVAVVSWIFKRER